MKKILFIAGLFLTANMGMAQDSSKVWAVGFQGGILVPGGEIRQNAGIPSTEKVPFQAGFMKQRVSEVKFGGEVSIRRFIDKVWSLELQLMFGKLQGMKTDINKEDKTMPLGGVYFTSDIVDVSAGTAINLTNIKAFNPNNMERVLNVMLHLGLGMSFYESQLHQLNNAQHADAVVAGERYKTNGKAKELMIPVGLGIKYQFNDDIDMMIGWSMRLLMAPTLDAYWADTKTINTAPNDKYTFTSIGFAYKIAQ